MKLHNSKKGAALAYVIIVAAVLLVLAAALVTAALGSIDFSQKTSDSRQAYLTAKSAIEYAKGQLAKDAKDSSSKLCRGKEDVFYVKVSPNDQTSFQVSSAEPAEKEYAAKCEALLYKKTQLAVDGEYQEITITTTYAGGLGGRITSVAIQDASGEEIRKITDDGDGKKLKAALKDLGVTDDSYYAENYLYQVTVAADVAYRNSNRRQKLTYECEIRPQYTEDPAPEPPPEVEEPEVIGNAWPGFMVAGARYGDHLTSDSISLLNYYTFIDGAVEVPYPVVFPESVIASEGKSSELSAPELYFMKSDGLIMERNSSLSLRSDFIYFKDSISMYTSYNNIGLKLYGLNGNGGIVHFEKDIGATGVTIPKGTYWFDEGTDLAQSDVLEHLRVLSQEELQACQRKFDIVGNGMLDNLISGESKLLHGGSNWLKNGSFDQTPFTRPSAGGELKRNDWFGFSLAELYQKDVVLYVDDVGSWNSNLKGNSQFVYPANSLTLQYVSGDDFAVPSKTVVFKADNITLNTQENDTDAQTAGKPKITGRNKNSSLILESKDGVSPVGLTILNPLTIVCYDKDGKELEYTIPVPEDGKYYLVPSGTDLLDGESAWVKQIIAYVEGGGGSGGGSGGGESGDPVDYEAAFTRGVYS